MGLGGFTYFGLRGLGDERDLRACEPSCSQASIDGVAQRYLVADVSLAVSIIAAGLAAVVFVTSAPKGARRAASF